MEGSAENPDNIDKEDDKEKHEDGDSGKDLKMPETEKSQPSENTLAGDENKGGDDSVSEHLEILFGVTQTGKNDSEASVNSEKYDRESKDRMNKEDEASVTLPAGDFMENHQVDNKPETKALLQNESYFESATLPSPQITSLDGQSSNKNNVVAEEITEIPETLHIVSITNSDSLESNQHTVNETTLDELNSDSLNIDVPMGDSPADMDDYLYRSDDPTNRENENDDFLSPSGSENFHSVKDIEPALAEVLVLTNSSMDVTETLEVNNHLTFTPSSLTSENDGDVTVPDQYQKQLEPNNGTRIFNVTVPRDSVPEKSIKDPSEELIVTNTELKTSTQPPQDKPGQSVEKPSELIQDKTPATQITTLDSNQTSKKEQTKNTTVSPQPTKVKSVTPLELVTKPSPLSPDEQHQALPASTNLTAVGVGLPVVFSTTPRHHNHRNDTNGTILTGPMKSHSVNMTLAIVLPLLLLATVAIVIVGIVLIIRRKQSKLYGLDDLEKGSGTAKSKQSSEGTDSRGNSLSRIAAMYAKVDFSKKKKKKQDAGSDFAMMQLSKKSHNDSVENGSHRNSNLTAEQVYNALVGNIDHLDINDNFEDETTEDSQDHPLLNPPSKSRELIEETRQQLAMSAKDTQLLELDGHLYDTVPDGKVEDKETEKPLLNDYDSLAIDSSDIAGSSKLEQQQATKQSVPSDTTHHDYDPVAVEDNFENVKNEEDHTYDPVSVDPRDHTYMLYDSALNGEANYEPIPVSQMDVKPTDNHITSAENEPNCTDHLYSTPADAIDPSNTPTTSADASQPYPTGAQPSLSAAQYIPHLYDPVYIPHSDAIGMNQRVDSTGYVRSRHPHPRISQTYEEIQYADLGLLAGAPQVTAMQMGASATSGVPNSSVASENVADGPPLPPRKFSNNGATSPPRMVPCKAPSASASASSEIPICTSPSADDASADMSADIPVDPALEDPEPPHTYERVAPPVPMHTPPVPLRRESINATTATNPPSPTKFGKTRKSPKSPKKLRDSESILKKALPKKLGKHSSPPIHDKKEKTSGSPSPATKDLEFESPPIPRRIESKQQSPKDVHTPYRAGETSCSAETPVVPLRDESLTTQGDLDVGATSKVSAEDTPSLLEDILDIYDFPHSKNETEQPPPLLPKRASTTTATVPREEPTGSPPLPPRGSEGLPSPLWGDTFVSEPQLPYPSAVGEDPVVLDAEIPIENPNQDDGSHRSSRDSEAYEPVEVPHDV